MKYCNKRILSSILIFATAFALAGCASSQTASTSSNVLNASSVVTADTSAIDWSYSTRDQDPSYDVSSATKITLGTASSISGSGATVSGSTVTITAAGTYILSGTLTDGQIVVNAGDDAKVQIVLNAVTITCSNGPALVVNNADKVFVTLASTTSNTLSDGSTHATVTNAQGEATDQDGVIFSYSDIAFNGSGSLTINASYANGIVGKDDVVFTGGSYTVNAKNDGIQGKDSVKILNGTFTITAGGDGIQSSRDDNTAKGFIAIDGGTFAITSTDDGIHAYNVVRITGGSGTITAGGGAGTSTTTSATSTTTTTRTGMQGASSMQQQQSSANTSTSKGIVSDTAVIVTGGSYTVNAGDDAVHSNASIEVSGGTLKLSAGDDGMHADTSLLITAGDITISKSYEGIEGANITIGGGTIHITSSDDGLNAAGGSDSSASQGLNDQFSQSTSTGYYINIYGGYLCVTAAGDGLDSNGDLYITGGTTVVNCSSGNDNNAIDWQTSGVVDGGVVASIGSSGMAENFSSNSTQGSILYNSATFQAGTVITLADSSGNVIFSFTPTVTSNSLLLSAPGVANASSYSIYTGGTSTGTDGFTLGGTLNGTKAATVTASSGGTYSTNGGAGNSFGPGTQNKTQGAR